MEKDSGKIKSVERDGIVLSEHPPFPKNMLVELSNRCNHRCIFCANRKMKRPYGDCDKNSMVNIIRQAKELGTEEIGFYLTGEPFMCKNLEDYVEESKRSGFKYIYLTTNGALANVERVIDLAEKGLDSIKFSINAGTRENYKLIHGRDDFGRVIDNIKYLGEYIKKNKGGGLNYLYHLFVQNII